MINQSLSCERLCGDVSRTPIFSSPPLDPREIRLVLISEAAPAQPSFNYYQDPKGAFFQATQTAFRDAGIEIRTYGDITRLGVYLTTAIKCSKNGYGASGDTIQRCSHLLEEEISQFPNIEIILCMGDAAIKAMNHITRRRWHLPAIPAGSTYRIRKEAHILQGIRYFPSYTQTGESCRIEKSKRRMIAEDIRHAMRLMQKN